MGALRGEKVNLWVNGIALSTESALFDVFNF